MIPNDIIKKRGDELHVTTFRGWTGLIWRPGDPMIITKINSVTIYPTYIKLNADWLSRQRSWNNDILTLTNNQENLNLIKEFEEPNG